jgi:hypothetical protein
MKTITQFVQQGINDCSELQDALQTAMRLEFSTLPPYLCAEWSISGNDQDGVAGMIHDIVLQEMFHFALAGNMLSAIRGKLKIAHPQFLPSYPTNTLPGEIHQNLTVDLRPLSKEQLQVFMQIETPEFPPVQVAAVRAPGPATIGEFYTTLWKAFENVNPSIDPNALFVTRGAEVFQIKSIKDAQNAIERIKGEGEGAPGEPDQPVNPDRLAHFYVFKEIFIGNILSFDPKNGKLVPVPGKSIRLPSVFPFEPSAATPNSSITFNRLLSQLLTDLEACWTKGASLGKAISDMTELGEEGRSLINQGIRPDFAWVARA